MNIILDLEYADVGNFSDGLARIKTEEFRLFESSIEKYGFIDRLGKNCHPYTI